MPIATIKGGHPPINQVDTGTLGGSALHPIDKKTDEVAGRALRTWSQFGGLVASYLTLGLVSAPPAPISGALPVSVIPESVGPPIEEGERTPGDPPLPATFISVALENIKAFFTAIYRMLFGVEN